ncbi:MAG: glucosaminidase domain-containing protein, partial [Candidatus Aureabacteria bacterium]|nr:glucosaminidase domain-containing protein [Candidatus Auribacterota bacterium]
FENASIEHAPVHKKSLIRYTSILLFLFCLIFIIRLFQNHIFEVSQPETKPVSPEQPFVYVTEWDEILYKMRISGFKKWNDSSITTFIRDLTPIVMRESLKTGAPPAAILSIACLESGFGAGYIAGISGNILSLNAKQNETMLPPLTVYVYKNKIIFNKIKLKEVLSVGKPLEIQLRPASLKKDYRMEGFGGGTTHLDYFIHHPQQRYLAWEKNIQDLLYDRLNPKSKNIPYLESYRFCQELKNSGRLDALLADSSAIKFLYLIGGRPLSFNPREEWRTKTEKLVVTFGFNQFLKLYLNTFKDSYDLSGWE